MNRIQVKRFSLVIFLLLIALPALAQSPKGALASLIETGNRKAALERIRTASVADLNEAQPDGTRPIHWAVHHVDYELLAALIAKKVTLNVRNDFGSTPIAQAAELGDARMVKMLLDAGAEPEGANSDGETSLMLAIKTGETAVVDLLIKAGANVNTIEKFHKQTPLMWAATAPRNAGAMTKLLLAKGADVKPRALFTDWPSQITSEPRAQYRPVGGLTALLYAARDGCSDCIDALIGAGADVNFPTPDGVTALMLALDNDHNDVVKLLMDRGANPRVWDWWGRTALYIAIDRKEALLGASRAKAAAQAAPRPSVSSMDIINSLLAAGVEINAQLLMERPSRSGNSGRFIDPQLNIGCTPLMRATIGDRSAKVETWMIGGDTEVVRALLAKGANPNINTAGLTPFLVAAGVGPGYRVGATGLAMESSIGGPVNKEVMELLLQNSADVNAQVTGTLTYSMRISRAASANEGRTALHMAAMEGKVDLVRYLLSKGASPEIKDAGGLKPIDLVPGGAPSASAPPLIAPATAAAATAAEIRSLLQTAAPKK
jgi:ankyrin repeat protein